MALRAPVWQSLSLLAIIGANFYVFLMINFWNHWARFLFAQRNPEYVKAKVATISQSISDPSVGEPFAFWMTPTALLLLVIIAPIAFFHLRAGKSIRPHSERVFRLIAVLIALAAMCQVIAVAGIIVLSNFRFPEFNHAHMMGSYLFFVGQAFTILLSSIACYALDSRRSFAGILAGDTSLKPGMNVFRWKFGLFTVLSVVAYVILFFVKDWDFQFGKALVYHTYVYLEPNVITFFLAYLLSFNVDLWQAAFKRQAVPGQSR